MRAGCKWDVVIVIDIKSVGGLVVMLERVSTSGLQIVDGVLPVGLMAHG